MCEPAPFPDRPAARYRDPILRDRAAALKADGIRYADIGRRLGVSAATVQRLVDPLPPADPEPPRPTACRNCGRAKVSRPRGLCWVCYYTPGAKERFASVSKYARRGVPTRKGRRPPATPTDATPGTEAKLLVLIGRAERGERLWHDRDHQAERPPDPVETPLCRVARPRPRGSLDD